LFFQPEQCFSFTTIQPEQYFQPSFSKPNGANSAKFLAEERIVDSRETFAGIFFIIVVGRPKIRF